MVSRGYGFTYFSLAGNDGMTRLKITQIVTSLGIKRTAARIVQLGKKPYLEVGEEPTELQFGGVLHGVISLAMSSYPDPQRDLKIRSPRTIWEIILGLYRGYNGFI